MSTIISGNTPSSFGDDVSAPNLILPTAPVVGYQQGTWTPRLSNTGGTEVTTWSAPSLVQGDWARVGNLVTINGIVRAQNTNNVSTPGISVAVKDFPYPVDNSACYSTASIGQMISINVANEAAVTMYVEPTQDYCYMQIRTSSTVPADFTPSAFNSTTSGLIFSASYITSDTTWTPINGATVS